jgi:hypothetical protein
MKVIEKHNIVAMFILPERGIWKTPEIPYPTI